MECPSPSPHPKQAMECPSPSPRPKQAMECISLIGVAVGKERFGPDAKEVMEILIKTQTSTLDPDDPQVSFLLQACWLRLGVGLGLGLG